MKKIFLCQVFIVIGLTLNSQIDFELFDIEETWFRINQDASLPSLQDTFQSINIEITGFELLAKDQMIIDGNILELFTSGTGYGTFLSSTNISSGELNWVQPFNLTNDDRIEIDLSIYQRTDNDFEISGMRLLDPSIPNLFPFGYAVRKIISSSGILSDRKFQNFENDGCICNNPNGQLGRTLPIIEDSLYITVCSYPSNDGQLIQILKRLDQEGRVLDTLSFITNALENDELQSHLLIDFIKTSDDTFLIASSSTSNPQDSTKTIAELIFINSNGELLSRKDISSELNYAPFFNNQYNDNNIYIESTLFKFSTEDPNDIAYNFLLLDQAGNQIVNIKEYDLLDGQEVGQLRVDKLSNEEYLLLGTQDHCIKYFSLDKTGVVKHLKTYCYNDFSIEIDPTFIYSYNDSILLNGIRVKDSNGKSFELTFALDIDEVLLTSSNHIANKNELPGISLKPNPAREFLIVNFEIPKSGLLSLVDMSGNLIKRILVDSKSQLELNISNLETGKYVLKFWDSKRMISKSFIKIK